MAIILVVEDEQCVREMLSAVLSREGHTVLSSESARRARAFLLEHDVALIITDIFMPGTDGLELTSELKETYPTIPIIAISGGSPSGAGGYLTAARQRGAEIALPKPFRPREIRAAVDTLLAGSVR